MLTYGKRTQKLFLIENSNLGCLQRKFIRKSRNFKTHSEEISNLVPFQILYRKPEIENINVISLFSVDLTQFCWEMYDGRNNEKSANIPENN